MAPTNYEWTMVTDHAAFPPRDGAGALVYKDEMWLIGGWNPRDKVTNPIQSDCNNEVWNSTDGADWTKIKPNTHLDDATFDQSSDWEARHTAGYVVFQNKMWIVGGDPLLGRYQYDVWNSEDGKSWEWVNKDCPVPWGPRTLHYTFVFQGKIWILGGQTLPQFAPADLAFYHDVWNSEDGVNWTQVEMPQPFEPCRGMIGGSTIFNDRIWMLGGGTYAIPDGRSYVYYNDVWSSSDGSNWECHTRAAPWPGRVYHDVAVFDDKLWVMEGQRADGNSNDVWYSSDGVDWHEVPDTPWAVRHASSVFVYKDALWMLAGNSMDQEVWRLVRHDT